MRSECISAKTANPKRLSKTPQNIYDKVFL